MVLFRDYFSILKTPFFTSMNPLISFSEDVKLSLGAIVKRVIDKKDYVSKHEGEYTKEELGVVSYYNL